MLNRALTVSFVTLATFFSFVALGAKLVAAPAFSHRRCLTNVDCYSELRESCVEWVEDSGNVTRTCELPCTTSKICQREHQCVNWRGGRGAVCLHVRWPKSIVSDSLAVFRASEGVEFKECADDRCFTDALASCEPAHELTVVADVEGAGVAYDLYVVRRPHGCRVAAIVDQTQAVERGCTLQQRECPNLSSALSDDPEGRGCSTANLPEPRPCRPPNETPFPAGPEFTQFNDEARSPR